MQATVRRGAVTIFTTTSRGEDPAVVLPFPDRRTDGVGSAPSHGDPTALQSGIYEGTVIHHRFEPIDHQFSYRIVMAYLDLAEIDGADRRSAGRPDLPAHPSPDLGLALQPHQRLLLLRRVRIVRRPHGCGGDQHSLARTSRLRAAWHRQPCRRQGHARVTLSSHGVTSLLHYRAARRALGPRGR
jgi:hypothetical protein